MNFVVVWSDGLECNAIVIRWIYRLYTFIHFKMDIINTITFYILFYFCGAVYNKMCLCMGVCCCFSFCFNILSNITGLRSLQIVRLSSCTIYTKRQAEVVQLVAVLFFSSSLYSCCVLNDYFSIAFTIKSSLINTSHYRPYSLT